MSTSRDSRVQAYVELDDTDVMVMRLCETGRPGAWLKSDYTVEIAQ